MQSLLSGHAGPLGAHCVQTAQGSGVNFAIWSENASQVELCVFASGQEQRYKMPAKTDGIWHGFLPGAGVGLLYGYRVHGEYDPPRGRHFNASKLLLDPYARQLHGQLIHDDSLFGYQPATSGFVPDHRNSASVMPACVVVEDQFDWRGIAAPDTPLIDTVLYELHVKGYTQLHPDVPASLRGTYLGLAEPVIIEHLQHLGVTAIELLPCASHVSEFALQQRGLSNYWGYNPISFFAPHAGYAFEDPIREFQFMVRAMHQAGIEVIVDVVYNHTAEGDARGPTLSFRGIDNSAYYLLDPDDPSAYSNNSGCGNSLAVDRPVVLNLVLDSLRYWVEVLHVDGFRFDLGPSLARTNGQFDTNAAFFRAVDKDPVLSRVKLIAEPWDVGHDGYRLGQFPAGWSEWNDRYRSTVRSFWRGDAGTVGDMASRLSGSSDVFGERGPLASINYVTAHDGFTLADLVSYQSRHNEKNGENNADGDRHNLSWNHGVEGPTSDPDVARRRAGDKRALLATLMLSHGVPMLLGGDELGRTQHGNNNAYCQDNETSWIDWQIEDGELIDYVARLTALRRQYVVFRRNRHLTGPLSDSDMLHDVEWLTASGNVMQQSQWNATNRHVLAVFLRGVNDPDGASHLVPDNHNALLLLNGSDQPVNFAFPDGTGPWECVLNSAKPNEQLTQLSGAARAAVFDAAPRSLVLLISRH